MLPPSSEEMSQGDSREWAGVGEAEAGGRGAAGPLTLLSGPFLSPGPTPTVSPNKQGLHAAAWAGVHGQAPSFPPTNPAVTMGRDGLKCYHSPGEPGLLVHLPPRSTDIKYPHPHLPGPHAPQPWCSQS